VDGGGVTTVQRMWAKKKGSSCKLFIKKIRPVCSVKGKTYYLREGSCKKKKGVPGARGRYVNFSEGVDPREASKIRVWLPRRGEAWPQRYALFQGGRGITGDHRDKSKPLSGGGGGPSIIKG